MRYLSLVLLLHGVSALSEAADRKLALVVGVNSYGENSNLPQLNHAENDATRLSEALRNAGYTVFEMTHDVAREKGKKVYAPNLAYIRDQIDGVLSFPNIGAGDSVLISLHGHGVQFNEVDDQGAKTSRFYFCPADSTVKDIDTANQLTVRNRLLPLDELYKSLDSCKATRKLLIVDTSRKDPTRPDVFRSGLPSSTLPKLPPPPRGIAAFFSCKANQRAIEDPELKQGVFTHFLVQGLEGSADQPVLDQPVDGVITMAELTSYVSKKTYAYVYRKYNGARQSPDIKGEFDTNLPVAKILLKPQPLKAPFTKEEAVAAQKTWAKELGTEVEFTNSVGMKFRVIPPGEFMMGSPADENGQNDEHPQHGIELTIPFSLQTTEVTQGQWEAVMETTPWRGEDYVKEGKNYAATFVTWEDATAFCRKLSQKEGKTYRLPMEAEWEYACRAGTTTMHSFDDNVAKLVDYAWVEENALYKDEKYAHIVGLKRPNNFGLHDMHGNVWEWCGDWYAKDYYGKSPVKDPTGPTSGKYRVSRGGSWDAGARFNRSADRRPARPGFRHFGHYGFRVVIE
tara:strand:+ start:2029 stop:3732 length:1704 start_codon:yes stop_codon:yes gene_type:complete